MFMICQQYDKCGSNGVGQLYNYYTNITSSSAKNGHFPRRVD